MPSSSSSSSSSGSAPGPPPLSFHLVTAPDDKRRALRLVADSIAQQRQVASLAVIFHPVCVAALALACWLTWRRCAHDPGTALIALSGIVVAYLAAVRLLTSRYIALAEAFRCDPFLAAPDGAHDLVVVARYGSDVIGTLVLRLLRYRNNGIGTDLLRLAVMITRNSCGDDALVTFAPDHANSALPLIHMFNRPFTRRDQRAAKALQHALRACHGAEGRLFEVK